MNRRRLVITAVGGVSTAALMRTSSAQTPQASPAAGTRQITDSSGVQTIPANPQRILALGEEMLLADLLELGIKPAASSGNYPQTYVGIDPSLTQGLTPFTMWDANVENLILLQPDLVLVPESYYAAAHATFDTIEELAPMVMLPSTDDWQSDFVFLASVFGLEADAEGKIEDLEAEIEATKANLAIEGETASFATIYPAASDVTLWLTPAIQILDVGVALGVQIVSDAADYDVDRNGRVWISFERANEITGETLIMLQTTGGLAPEEEESYASFTESEAWSTLPAVENDRVFVIERVGHPGAVSGRGSLLAEYRRIFGDDASG